MTEMLLGERALHGLQGGITYDPQAGLIGGNINGAIEREPIGGLHDRFAKLKARDNLLGAVLARLGADPGARESAAHAAVGKLLERNEALEKWNERLSGCLEKLRHKLGLEGADPERLVDQVLAQHADLTSAIARADAGAIADVAAQRQRAELAEAEVKALTEENAKLKAELEASTTREKRTDAALRSQMDDTRAAEAYIASLKAKLAETDLDRVLAEARVSGLAAELQALERAMREKLRP